MKIKFKVFGIEAVIDSLAQAMADYGTTQELSDTISEVCYAQAVELANLDGTYNTSRFLLEVGKRAKAKGWEFAPEGV